jgi:hypothetical protein
MKMANKKYNQIKTKTKIQEKTKTNNQTIKHSKTQKLQITIGRVIRG